MLNDPLQRLAAARTQGNWVEAAEICEKELGDIDQAMTCWKQVIEAEPNRLDAHDALQKLCSMRGDWVTLASVLQHRAKIVPRDQLKGVLVDLVKVYREQLNDETTAAKIESRLGEL